MSEKRYILIDEKIEPKGAFDKFKHFIAATFKLDLLVGLKITLKQMLFSKSHTLKYPMQKMELNARYRGIHRLLKFVESENERCIGCGLCEKICVSNCISMKTSLGEDGRKKVASYTINLSRCVYCGFCADVCPELAIVCGQEYEVASENKIIFGTKNEFLFIPGALMIILKSSLVFFFFLWTRASWPHLRVDQLSMLCWKILLPLGILNVVITGFELLI